MQNTLQFQIRLTVADELARALRADPTAAAYEELAEVLRRHHAVLMCQFDAFAGYVSEAEKEGIAGYPLYEWTKQTIENSEKKAKYLRSFTAYVDDQQVYSGEIADSLERALRALSADAGIERVSRFDTDPAHNPQPPASGR